MNPKAVPESRVYRHTRCNSETTISGTSFEVASNPLSDMTRTWCSQCNSFFPLSEYAWADSGELICDYYTRHGARATAVERFLCSKKFLAGFAVVGFVLGAVAGFFLFRDDQTWLKLLMVPFMGGIGMFVAAAIASSVIEKAIVRRVCGVSDTRVLK